MTRAPDGILGTRRPETAGLPIFSRADPEWDIRLRARARVVANRTNTSQDAARKIAPRAMSIREQVYRYVESRGARGATRLEISGGINRPENTVRPRVQELRAVGCLHEDGARDGCAVLKVGDRPFHAATVATMLNHIRHAKEANR